MLAPPYTATTEIPFMCFLNNSISFTICIHNSRVGHTINACGKRCSASKICNNGKPKAAVLPVPVCAKPIKSLVPESNTGIAFSCISVGFTYPNSDVACTILASKPNSSKVIMLFFKFGANVTNIACLWLVSFGLSQFHTKHTKNTKCTKDCFIKFV